MTRTSGMRDRWQDLPVPGRGGVAPDSGVHCLSSYFIGGLKTYMRKLMLLILMLAVVTFTGIAAAQVMNDVLGAHNLGGHGCATCHAPHSGACGNTKGQGDTGCDDTTGQIALWGRGFMAKTYTINLPHGANYTFTTPATEAGFIGGDSDPLFDTASCLTCHDGSVTTTNMKGYTFETNEDGGNPPTYFATEVSSPLTNQHPVHTTYSCGSHNWDCQIDATTGTVYWGNSAAQVAFMQNYGRGVSFYSIGPGQTTIGGGGNGNTNTTAGAYIECTTCHNQHVMGGGNPEYSYSNSQWSNGNTHCYNGNTSNPYGGCYINGNVSGYKNTWFFIKGWYDVKTSTSNSATQFCRQCHAGESNEENNMFGVPTT